MAEKSPHDVTHLLGELQGGNRDVVNSLMPLVYEELHGMALGQLRRERKDHTLNATALVHEAYLKLVDQRNVDWQNRAHFFAIASQAMRRILINYAHRRMAEKRGGGEALV
ncbi:MAG: RNA polymerase subunit sigma-70, partial [Gemmatimonadetes bacterium]|nr:RNA polymerase subunit sigma-70 [Gemmatimonadota bacterium]